MYIGNDKESIKRAYSDTEYGVVDGVSDPVELRLPVAGAEHRVLFSRILCLGWCRVSPPVQWRSFRGQHWHLYCHLRDKYSLTFYMWNIGGRTKPRSAPSDTLCQNISACQFYLLLILIFNSWYRDQILCQTLFWRCVKCEMKINATIFCLFYPNLINGLSFIYFLFPNQFDRLPMQICEMWVLDWSYVGNFCNEGWENGRGGGQLFLRGHNLQWQDMVICDLVQVFQVCVLGALLCNKMVINNNTNENHDVLMALGIVCLMPYKYL